MEWSKSKSVRPVSKTRPTSPFGSYIFNNANGINWRFRTKCPRHSANPVMIRPSMKCAPDLWVLIIENRSVNETKTSTVMPKSKKVEFRSKIYMRKQSVSRLVECWSPVYILREGEQVVHGWSWQRHKCPLSVRHVPEIVVPAPCSIIRSYSNVVWNHIKKRVSRWIEM